MGNIGQRNRISDAISRIVKLHESITDVMETIQQECEDDHGLQDLIILQVEAIDCERTKQDVLAAINTDDWR